MAGTSERVFVSYARVDGEFALKLARALRDASIPVWIDQMDVAAGDRWDRAVEQALNDAAAVLVVLSPAAVASTNVMDEASFALDEGKYTVPIICHPCRAPLRLRRLQHIDFTTGDYRASLDRLVQALRRYQHPASPNTPIAPSPPTTISEETSTTSTRPSNSVTGAETHSTTDSHTDDMAGSSVDVRSQHEDDDIESNATLLGEAPQDAITYDGIADSRLVAAKPPRDVPGLPDKRLVDDHNSDSADGGLLPDDLTRAEAAIGDDGVRWERSHVVWLTTGAAAVIVLVAIALYSYRGSSPPPPRVVIDDRAQAELFPGRHGTNITLGKAADVTLDFTRTENDSAMAAYSTISVSVAMGRSSGGLETRHDVKAALVTGYFFELLSVHPVAGRSFSPQDLHFTADPMAILSYKLWVEIFKRDLSIIGSEVKVVRDQQSSMPTIIIGVMSEGFSYPGDTELWLNVVPAGTEMLTPPRVVRRETR